MALDAPTSSAVGVFAVAAKGISLSLTIFVVSSVGCHYACPDLLQAREESPNTCTPWAVLLTYALLSLPVAALLLAGILTGNTAVIRAWQGATVVQFVVEMAVSGYLVSELANIEGGRHLRNSIG